MATQPFTRRLRFVIRPAVRAALRGMASVLLALSTRTSLGVEVGSPDLARCAGIKDLVVVAHQDDDLLFMNPDIAASIRAGGCVRVVYLTAAERNAGNGYMLSRERGVRAAYSHMAGQADIWRQGIAAIGAYQITYFTLLGDPRIQLWHMRLKDPWLGKGWGSLTPLSRLESVPGHFVDTRGTRGDVYTRQELVATLARIIQSYEPTTVRHMDDTVAIPYSELCWRCAGHDHPDHIASARLTREAMILIPGNYAQIGYVDYPTQERDANLTPDEIGAKSETFRYYAWQDQKYCAGSQQCAQPTGPAAAWVQREYYVSRDDTAPALLTDADGNLLLFASGEENNAANLWDSQRSSWLALGGRTPEQISAFSYPDAAIGVMARDAIGKIWLNLPDARGSWGGWRTIPGSRLVHAPVVSPETPLAAVATGNDGRYYWSMPSGDERAWPAWAALPALPHGRTMPAIVGNSRRLMVFAVDREGGLFVTSRRAGGNGGWAAWQAIAAPPTDGGLGVLSDGRGLTHVYFRNRETGHLLHIAQLPPPNGAGDAKPLWSDATDLGIRYIGRPALALNAQGATVIVAQESVNGALWLHEASENVKLADHAASAPVLRATRDGLYLAFRLPGDAQTYLIMTRRHEKNAGDVPLQAGGKAAWTRFLLPEMPEGGGSSFDVFHDTWDGTVALAGGPY